MRKEGEVLLKIDSLAMVFGGLRAIDSVNMEIRQGEIVALIGPNGAGKTTLFNCVTGMYRASEGSVLLRPPLKNSEDKSFGQEVFLEKKKPHDIIRLGLARTFQNIRLFNHLTVLENVMLGRHKSLSSGLFASLLRTKTMQREEERVVEESWELLKLLGLEAFANERASSLPYGAQRRLEIARALATDPFLILLDEPAAGMNPNETQELVETINLIRDHFGITVLLIEHDMSLVMNVSEWIYVVDYGRLIAEGSPEEVSKNPQVIKAYLGE